MAFTIAHPKGGTYSTPTRLPRRFIAVGKKADGDVAAGVLMSVDRNGNFDGHLILGGTPIPYKKAGGDVDPKKWALFFNLAGVGHGQRFALIAYEKSKFPPAVTDRAVVPVVGPDREQFFAVVRPTDTVAPVVVAKADGGDPNLDSVNPETNGQIPHDQFVAYGELPSGDVDVTMGTSAGTKLIDSSTNSDVCFPDYPYINGTFWAAFFPTVDNVAHPFVDLKVVYSTSGTIEWSYDIELT